MVKRVKSFINSDPILITIKKFAVEMSNTEVYLVGGLVRNFVLDIHDLVNTDYDVVIISSDYQKAVEALTKHISTELRTRTNISNFKEITRLSFKMNDCLYTIDLTEPHGKTIENDLNVRDLNINSLAIPMHNDSYDVIGDISFLESKIIDLQYENSFIDDPIRMLRAVRLYATINDSLNYNKNGNNDNNNKDFILSGNVIKNLLECHDLLINQASERSLYELRKIFSSLYVAKSLDIMKNAKILDLFCEHSESINDFRALQLNAGNKKYSDDLAISLVLLINNKDDIVKFLDEIAPSKQELKDTLRLHDIIYSTDWDNLTERTVFSMRRELLRVTHILKVLCQCECECKIGAKVHKFSQDNFEQFKALSKKLDFANEKAIDGDKLLKIGLEQSTNFKDLLEELRFRLCTGQLKKSEIESNLHNIVNELIM